MIAGIETQWLVYGLVAVLALFIAWRMLGRGKSTRDRSYKPDVLDEGQAPAARNQALIDAAPAAQVVMPPAVSDALGGMGEIVARAAQDEVEEARAVEVAPPPPPPPPASVPEQKPEPEVIAEPAIIPELEEVPAPAQIEEEVQAPDAVSEPAPEPEPEPEPAPELAPTSTADDLAKIKGLGRKLQALLPTLGLSTYAQIAALSEADLAALDPKLGPFAGRPTRDGWVEQAKYLAAGDVAGFEARFGKV